MLRRTLPFFFAVVCVVLPYAASAQSTDLSATIRQEILRDSRSSAMSSDQIDALVALLTTKAEQEGMTAESILWRPVLPTKPESHVSFNELTVACFFPQATCDLSNALGFSPNDTVIPALYGIGSVATLILLVFLRKRIPAPTLPQKPLA